MAVNTNHHHCSIIGSSSPDNNNEIRRLTLDELAKEVANHNHHETMNNYYQQQPQQKKPQYRQQRRRNFQLSSINHCHHHRNHYHKCHNNFYFNQKFNHFSKFTMSAKTTKVMDITNNNNNVDEERNSSSEMPRITHVIFDLDGLLLDTEFAYEQATQQIVQRYGRSFTLEDKLKISCQKMKNSTSTLARIKSTISGNDRTYYTIFRDTTLYAYRPQDFDHDSMNPTKEPEIVLNMNICEVNPDVLASQQRYCFQIIDSSKSRCYYYVKCQSELQYAKWFAACKQASQGHTMAHSSYDEQVHNTLKLLQIQSKFSKTKNVNKQELKSLDVDPSQFIAPRFLKRKSKEQVNNLFDYSELN